MEQAKRRATGKHQRALPKGLASRLEKIKLLFKREAFKLVITEIVQCRSHLSQIALNEPLGTKARIVVEGGIGNVAQVTVQPFVQVKHELVDVIALTRLTDL